MSVERQNSLTGKNAWMLCTLALAGAPSLVHAQTSPEEEPAPVTEPVPDAAAESATESETASEAEAESESDAESDAEDGEESDGFRLADVTVSGVAEEAFEAGGSVHVVSEETLEELNYDDPLAILARVPGVNIRQEDGFGLRPNIGLRGASSERSRKITLMEDGVLLAPAPYSAPAAYYFPLMTRMTGVEVSLGPASILYGPHTVGGAINMIGRQIPSHRVGNLDLALGTTWYGRLHAHYGDSNEWGGFVIEAVHLRSDGFRTFDWAQHDTGTGFDRTDILARADVHGDLNESIYHRLELTLGLGLEGSNETYLGMTDADVRTNPFGRYGASSTDRMEWWRTRAQLRYEMEIGDDVDITVTAYRHDFDRTWQRLESFTDGTSFYDVLQNPTGRNAVYYDAITGSDNGPGDPNLSLLRVRNQRTFISQGVQIQSRMRLETLPFRHDLTMGARLHYDEIARHHTGQDLYVAYQSLVPVNGVERDLDVNRAQAVALALFAVWRIQWERLSITPGIRTELIWNELMDQQTGILTRGQQRALLPGLGIQYELTDDVALFAGVHQGFSPASPGQAAGIRPEQSVNWEAGGRFGREDEPSHGQVAFFYSDYQNLTGDCSGAGGCGVNMLDMQFNAGNVTVLGVEAALAHTFDFGDVEMPIRASYTYSYTRFRSAFNSDNPQWGSVAIGDHLPYVPEHQGSAQMGLVWRMLRLDVTGSYMAAMRDRAGQGSGTPTEWTDDYLMLDAVARVNNVLPGFSVYVRGENLTDTSPIVSRRPYGARTNKPFMLQLGFEVAF